MPEVINIEPKHLTGKGGIGKGSQPRHGSDPQAYKRASWIPESPNIRRAQERDDEAPRAT